MRFSASAAVNAASWAVVVLLVGAAAMLADRLGFVGLLVLGGATWLVCVMAELDQDAPTWGVDVFKARMGERGSPEQQAALRAEREAFVSPLRFYRRCGMVLVAVGVAGFAWQRLLS